MAGAVNAPPGPVIHWLGFLWGLALFLPYPALPVGSASGIQLGHLMLLILVPMAMLNRAAIPGAWMLLGLVSIPQIVSLLANGVQPVDFNATLANLYALTVIPATAWVFWRVPRAMLTGVATVFCLHAAIGVLQVRGFSAGEFPLGSLYVNPAFAPLDPAAQEIYARYVRRPFGLFPEPSSLLAAAGPWLLVLLASLFDDSRRSRNQPVRGAAWLTIAGCLGMVSLMIASASGALVNLAIGLGALLLLIVWRHGARTPVLSATLLVLAALAGVALVAILTQRADSELSQSGGSWLARLASLQLGVQVLGQAGMADLWLGYGAGQVAKMAEQMAALDAVQSWVISHLVATGLVGAMSLALCALLLVRAVRRTGDPFTWTIVLIVWLAGPLYVTAYQDLFGLWALLALPLTVADGPGTRVPSARERPGPSSLVVGGLSDR